MPTHYYSLYVELASRPAIIGLRDYNTSYDSAAIRNFVSNEKKSDMVPYYDITVDEEEKKNND